MTFQTTIHNIPTLIKYLLAVGIAVFISLLCPNDMQFKYQFENGKTWKYEELRAPYRFHIEKTEEEMAAERIAALDMLTPYYIVQPGVAKEKKKIFLESFDARLKSSASEGIYSHVQRNTKTYQKYSTDLIDKIYARGIFKLSEKHREKDKDFLISVLSGNTIEKKTLESVTESKKANTVINDILYKSNLPEADFLIPLFDNIFTPNVFYSDTLTQKFNADELAKISTVREPVEKGEVIVHENEIITDGIYQKLVSFRDAGKNAGGFHSIDRGVYIGYLLLTVLIMGIFMVYLRSRQVPVFRHFNQLLFVLIWFFAYSYLVYKAEDMVTLSAYLIPFCIVPILLKNFFNDRLALFTHIVIVLIAGYISGLGYEFVLIHILAGTVAVLSGTETRYWSRFFFSIFLIFLTYLIAYCSITLIQEGSITAINRRVLSFLFFNVLLTMLAYPLIPLLEKLFGFTSNISLAELADLNRPLLKELAAKAPGTMQHSIQVANLSEVAARSIKANALLVKTSALYHDIGKMKNAEYFIENQNGNNPHDRLAPLDSAKIIIDHVSEGVTLAKKYGLPSVIIRFIQSHHGTTRTEYFYRKYISQHPDKEYDAELFQYSGPKPNSKEEAILMLADSLEAVSKTLKNATGQDIDNLVENIIRQKVSDGQLEHADLTFRELERCKEAFKQTLRSMNHVRIEYPK